MDSLAAHLAGHLNGNCYCAGTDIAQLQQWIDQDLAAHGVTERLATTHPHLFSTVPVFVDASHLAQAHQLIAAIESVVALTGFREAVLASASAIARHENDTRGAILGYDFHVGPQGVQLIEINTNAGGAMLSTLLIRAQQACCSEVRPLIPTAQDAREAENRLAALFFKEWRLARGRAPLRSVAIVDDAPEQQFLYPEFLLFKKLFEAHGLEAFVVDAQSLQFDGSCVRHRGIPIDLIYNRVTDFYLHDPTHSALREAFLRDAVVIAPDPRSHALYANKRNLVVLSDQAMLSKFGAETTTIERITRHVPHTRLVSADGREDWWAERKQWFFKPTSSFAGRGAYRGDKLTRRMFEEIVSGDYVAQRIVLPSTRNVSASESPLRWDLRVYVYEGRPLLQAARLYGGQTTNFRTLGGGFAPVFVVPVQSSEALSASKVCT